LPQVDDLYTRWELLEPVMQGDLLHRLAAGIDLVVPPGTALAVDA
jgi:hypothetical protein